MDPRGSVLRATGQRGRHAARGDELSPVADSYIFCEVAPPPSGPAAGARGDNATVVSKLNTLCTRYVHFQRSVEPCLYASTSGGGVSPSSSRSPSDGATSLSARGRRRAGGATASGPSARATLCVPDLESCWAETSPLPPTAVLTALYSVVPLLRVVADGVDEGEAWPTTPAAKGALQLHWMLCRCPAPASAVANADASVAPAHCPVSFRDAFAMTAVAAHVAAVGNANATASLPSSSSSSASLFSLAQQLRRTSALLGDGGDMISTDATPPPSPSPTATSVLDWPEEFLWGLLVSLLSSLALVHSAGLHLFGCLTAADVLCLACAPTLPRQLEQTWSDVAAAAAAGAARSSTLERRTSSSAAADDTDEGHRAATDAAFSSFCAAAVPSVLLPQATVTASTPCHHVFFVLRPTPELLQRRGGAESHIASRTATATLSVAQEVEQTTPAQQARYQAADLASVGALMSHVMELRLRGRQRGRGPGVQAPPTPSSELAFLVRRLSDCAGDQTTSTDAAPASVPTALQLLQLQALRLRAESWLYRRVAEEACDRLAAVTLHRNGAAGATSRGLPSTAPSLSSETAAGDQERRRRDAQLAGREARLAEREAKLSVMLRLYELTHEHLDALPLPQLQAAYAGADRTPRVSASPADATAAPSLTGHTGPREELLDGLLTSPPLRPPVAAHSSAHAGGAVTSPSAAALDDAVLLGLSPLVHAAAVEDTLLSASAATPSGLTDAWPVRSARRQLDVDDTVSGGPATPTAGHPRTVPAAPAAPSATATATATAMGGASPMDRRRVDVVVVDLDATDDTGEAVEARRATVPGETPGASPPPFVSSAVVTSPYRDMQTPVRAPPLPNMGYVGDVAGAVAAVAAVGAVGGGGGGGAGAGGSHSKYSALSLLRTPPSARRPGAAPGTAAGSPAATGLSVAWSPGSHSPESYRSSTRPYSGTSAPRVIPRDESRLSPLTRPSRRRSNSRGGGAGATATDDRVPLASDPLRKMDDGAAWAHQQLTALEELQTALRTQQPPTPRNRAPTTATAAAVSARARSPASPPLAPRAAPPPPPTPSPPQRSSSSSRSPAHDRTPPLDRDDAATVSVYATETGHRGSGGSTRSPRSTSGGDVAAERPRVRLSPTPASGVHAEPSVRRGGAATAMTHARQPGLSTSASGLSLHPSAAVTSARPTAVARDARRSLSAHPTSEHLTTTVTSTGSTSARGVSASLASSRSGTGGHGGPSQRFGDPYASSYLTPSVSFARSGASRTASSTTAVELLRRLRANTTV
ncbi:hypothetical protein NESM_000210500 [Novymonas esmeraldas]|uniref:Uncharacterized protein n=1 Tax=Novymonas esmeraldas TaxID=1808958 RepID=A0AAW0F639_9TRYP